MLDRVSGPPVRRRSVRPSSLAPPRFTSQAVRRRRVLALGLLTLLVVTGLVSWRARDAGPPAGAAVATSEGTAPTSAQPTWDGDPVASRGSGSFSVAPGSVRAPGAGAVVTVRVEVEGGTGYPAPGFADAVMRTLNDPRSWGSGATRSFARTDGPADIAVLLASPDTSAALCRPLVTRGTLSCSIGDRAIITTHRWAGGTPEFTDLGVYRQYVVNHEVGHVLGQGHRPCAGPGQLASVMQQQTIKVAPCTPNAWPHP